MQVLMFHDLRKTERGQALVEMALVTPLLILLLFGIMEFGRVMNNYILITDISREGARFAAVGGTDTSVRDYVNNMASRYGFNASLVTVELTPTSIEKRPRGSTIEVKVSYPVDIVAPVIGSIVGDPYVVVSRTTMRVEG